jgi:hypothetical protein
MLLAVGALTPVVGVASGCPSPPPQERGIESTPAQTARAAPDATPEAMATVELDARPEAEAAVAQPLPPDDPMELHRTSLDELIGLFAARDADGGPSRMWSSMQPYFGFAAGRFSQGNKPIAQHSIGRRACLDGLHGVVIQTDEQRAACHGMENMVPIYRKGDRGSAKACIDVFEFPNRACELPVVWGTPPAAQRICALEGKRLCTQEEWNLACAGDPEGKADRTYAYGDDLDLTICNTNKPQPLTPSGLRICDTRAAQSAWATCSTETEPSGAFPRCRSRFGVFDQHGNVAEMMTRREGDVVYTQLKGSAFFYVDVARAPKEAQKPGARETYPDHCGFDPRWHVEPLEGALHSNYHLGFRCCLSLP